MSLSDPILLGPPHAGSHPLFQELKHVVNPLGELLGPFQGMEFLSCYAHDAQTLEQKTPYAVFRPHQSQSIPPFVQICRKLGFILTSRGAGTGLSGSCLPGRQGIILLTGHLKEVLSYDKELGYVEVQCGMTVKKLNLKVEEDHWHFPYRMLSEGVATLAGILSTNARPWNRGRIPPLERLVTGVTFIDEEGLERKGRAAAFCGKEGSEGIITSVELSLEPLPQKKLSMARSISLEDLIQKVPCLEELWAIKSILWDAHNEKMLIELEGEEWRVLAAEKAVDRLFPESGDPGRPVPPLQAARSPSLLFVSNLPRNQLHKAYQAFKTLFEGWKDAFCQLQIQLLDGRMIALVEGMNPDKSGFLKQARTMLESWVNILEKYEGFLCGTHGVGQLFKDFMPPFFSESMLAYLGEKQRIFSPDNFLPSAGKCVERIRL